MHVPPRPGPSLFPVSCLALRANCFLALKFFKHISTSVDKSGEDLNHILSFLSCTVVKPLSYRNSKNPIQNAINVCLKVFGKFITETA